MRWMLRHCSFATVSLGARGCVSMDRAGSRGVAPGVRVPVVDTTGAGDAFTAGYLAAFLTAPVRRRAPPPGAPSGPPPWRVLGAWSSRSRRGPSYERRFGASSPPTTRGDERATETSGDGEDEDARLPAADANRGRER